MKRVSFKGTLAFSAALVCLALLALHARPSQAADVPTGRYYTTAANLPDEASTTATASPSSTSPTSTASTTGTTTSGTVVACAQPVWRGMSVPDVGTLGKISVRTPTDMWAVGERGILRWDGMRWNEMPAPPSGHIVDIAPIAENDALGVGSRDIFRWDGAKWTVMQHPDPPGDFTGYAFNAVAASGPDQALVVGSASFPRSYPMELTLSEYWNGTEWVYQDPGADGVVASSLMDVAFVSTEDAYAVGVASGTGPIIRSTAVHWSNGSWRTDTSNYFNLGAGFYTVAGKSPSDVWAAGSNVQSDGGRGVFHYDGSTWNSLPRTNHDYIALTGIAPIALNNVWVVGTTNDSNTPLALLLHWNGTSWSDSPHAGTALHDITALSAGDIWAVGADKDGHSAIEHYSAQYFSDAYPSDPFYPFIQCLTCRGVLGGYGDGTFRPNESVTRGQAAKIIANAAGYSDTIPSTRQTFADVPNSNPFWQFIERVAEHGAISGYACGGANEPCDDRNRGYFRPGNDLTRGQLAKITSSVVGYSETPTGQSFNDVPANSPFYVYVERAVLHGVLGGYSCGAAGEACPGSYFRSNNDVTRGQTAKIVANTFFPGCQSESQR